MRKGILIAMLMMAGAAVYAQGGYAHVSLMPGFQFGTKGYTAVDSGLRTDASANTNFTWSFDFGLNFREHVGLHMGYLYNDGKYKAKLTYLPTGTYLGEYSFKRRVSLFEIGPEFFMMRGEHGQIYGQLNLAHSFGGGTAYYYSGGRRYDLGNAGSNEFGFGAAAGYRYWFKNNLAVEGQLAYHHINRWEVNDFWDVRFGVGFRF